MTKILFILWTFLVWYVVYFVNSQRTPITQTSRKVDLLLSSGFLAFAQHSGFLRAVSETQTIKVERLVGTSSGSLAGSLFAAGYDTNEIANILSKNRPIDLCQPSWRIYKGAFSMDKLVNYLSTLLPSKFEDLHGRRLRFRDKIVSPLVERKSSRCCGRFL
eukprot:gene28768-37769_t